jgi:hypothetical protein
MLIQDQFGYFHDVPDERFGGWVNPGFGEVYDGLGNPLGFPALAALLPFAAKLLPMAANLLPGLGPSTPPPSPTAVAPPPVPFPPPMPSFPMMPSMAPPQVIVIREPAHEEPLEPPLPAPAVQGRMRVVFRRRGRRRRF